MNDTFLVLLWGIGSCEIEGPFGELDDAKSYLDDYSFADDEDHEAGMVISATEHYSRVV